MEEKEFTIDNLQKWLNEGESGLPYVFFALCNQMNSNQKSLIELIQKQDVRITTLEKCYKDVKPVVEDRKSMNWLKGNILGLISFVTATVNFYLLVRSLNLFSTLASKGIP